MQLTYAETERYGWLAGNSVLTQLAIEAEELESETLGFDDRLEDARRMGYSEGLEQDSAALITELQADIELMKKNRATLETTMRQVFTALTDGTVKLAPDRLKFSQKLAWHLGSIGIMVSMPRR